MAWKLLRELDAMADSFLQGPDRIQVSQQVSKTNLGIQENRNLCFMHIFDVLAWWRPFLYSLQFGSEMEFCELILQVKRATWKLDRSRDFVSTCKTVEGLGP